jgi:hypothetical protein
MYLSLNPMPSTITRPWLRLLLFFGLLLPTMALGSRREMRQDTLPGDTVRVWQAPISARAEPKRRTDPLALVSLGAALTGNIGVYWGPMSLALILTFSTIALVTGLISQARIKRRKQSLKGKGWALVGIGLAAWLVVIGFSALLIYIFLWWSLRNCC